MITINFHTRVQSETGIPLQPESYILTLYANRVQNKIIQCLFVFSSHPSRVIYTHFNNFFLLNLPENTLPKSPKFELPQGFAYFCG